MQLPEETIPDNLGRFQFLLRCRRKASRRRMGHCTSWLTGFGFLVRTLLSMQTKIPTAIPRRLKTMKMIMRPPPCPTVKTVGFIYFCCLCKQFGLCRHPGWLMMAKKILPNLRQLPHGNVRPVDSTLHNFHLFCTWRRIVGCWKCADDFQKRTRRFIHNSYPAVCRLVVLMSLNELAFTIILSNLVNDCWRESSIFAMDRIRSSSIARNIFSLDQSLLTICS